MADPGASLFSATPLFSTAKDGLRVTLRLQPSARRNAVEGLTVLADGRAALKARVTAPPEGGKANAAALKLLAKAWRLPKSSLAIVAGATDRTKTVSIHGDPARLAPQLNIWLKGLRAATAGNPNSPVGGR